MLCKCQSLYGALERDNGQWSRLAGGARASAHCAQPDRDAALATTFKQFSKYLGM